MSKVELKAVDTRLSYSSGQLLKNCTQKYFNYKVAGVPKDPDAEENYDAFNIGKAFHWVLESNMHTNTNLVSLLKHAVEEFKVQDKMALIHAMLLKYLKLHEQSGLACVYAELEVSDTTYLGFVDAILMDDVGYWWIADLKTAAKFNNLTRNKLATDPQLNLYAKYAREIALALKGKGIELDPDKFKGVRYRATTKASLKQRKDESYKDYVIRLYTSINSYDAVIEKEFLHIEETWEEHKRLHQLSLDLRYGNVQPTKNFSNCDSYFRPCEYWSVCHGCNYTDSKFDEMVKVTEV